MTVALAGRCAEKLVMGEANMSTAGGADLEHANNIAREMVYRCGFSRRLGPVAMMDTEEVYINKERSRSVANISTPLARIAMEECTALLEGAEAKAYYGLASNYAALEKLVDVLVEEETISGQQLAAILQEAGVKPFSTPFVEGFGWDEHGELIFPDRPEGEQDSGARGLASYVDSDAGSDGDSGDGVEDGTVNAAEQWHPLNPYQIRMDLPDLLTEQMF